MKIQIKALWLCVSLLLAGAEPRKAPPLLPPDERYKADVLMVVAHPDDDVVIGGYLAKITLDDHKRVAVVYCTKGDGGGNDVGYEAGVALGEMRTIEARRALASFGIENVWFLNGHDTPGQNVLWSLDNWNHGRALDEVVRLVRLTRPSVILTWLPDYVVGENHGDHQASGVLATEAFDIAGDPTKFPEQVSPPRDRTGMANLTEGLQPWQPEKLYYFTDAFEAFGPYWHSKEDFSPFRKSFLEGTGPTFETTSISPSRHKSYARLWAEQQSYYLTQEAYLAKEAFAKQNFEGFEYPIHLIFGKSVVGGSATEDIFEHVTSEPVPFVPVPGFHLRNSGGLSLELGGPWMFYKEFWKAHNLENLAKLIPVPEVAVESGHALHIPLIIRNGTSNAKEVRLMSVLPEGWRDKTQYAIYPLQPGNVYPVEAELIAPKTERPQWQQITWRAKTDGHEIGSVTLHVYAGKSGGLPQ